MILHTDKDTITECNGSITNVVCGAISVLDKVDVVNKPTENVVPGVHMCWPRIEVSRNNTMMEHTIELKVYLLIPRV